MSAAIVPVGRSRLIELEAVIERGLTTFVEVGAALVEIRDSRLYLADFSSFEAYCKQRWSISRPRAYQLIEAAETVGNLSTTVDSLPHTERQTRELSGLSPRQQNEIWAETIERHGPEPTASEVREVVRGKMDIHYSSESPEWYTPPQIVSAVLAVLGEIDLDPCSNPKPYRIPAARHFTSEDDGLTREWSGRVYMNPPYGDEISKWTDKLRAEYEDGGVDAAIALVPARVDTAWFRALRTYPRCFVSGRLKFSDVAASAPFPSALIYLGPFRRKFVTGFAKIGDSFGLLDG